MPEKGGGAPGISSACATICAGSSMTGCCGRAWSTGAICAMSCCSCACCASVPRASGTEPSPPPLGPAP
eukprot:15461218-Alexandrium_andersonii.AAC.1